QTAVRNVLVLFDFDVPNTRDITETVSLLARMARFIIADLTDPSSLPKELEAVVPSLAAFLWRSHPARHPLPVQGNPDQAPSMALSIARLLIDRPNFRGGTRTDLGRGARSLGCSSRRCIAVDSRYLRLGVRVKEGRETGSTETVADAQFVKNSAWKSSNDFN